MKKKIFIITPLFIALSIIELLLIGMSIYYIFVDNNNGNMLGGLITGIGAFINALLIGIQQAIASIKNINIKFLYVIEIVIILIGALLFWTKGISIE